MAAVGHILLALMGLCPAQTAASPDRRAPEPGGGPMLLSVMNVLEEPAVQPVRDPAHDRLPPFSRRRFFIEAGAVNQFPQLHESHHQVNRYLDRTLGWAPGFSSPREFYDFRRSGQLLLAYAAGGYTATEWLDLTFEMGGWGGELKDTSGPLFLGSLDTHFDYTTLFAQVGTRVYPVGRPEISGGSDPAAVLSGARPFLYQSFGTTRAESAGTAMLGPRGFPHLLEISLRRSDWIPTYKLGAGLEIPLDEHLSLITYGGYNFYFSRRDEFNGFSLTVAARLRF